MGESSDDDFKGGPSRPKKAAAVPGGRRGRRRPGKKAAAAAGTALRYLARFPSERRECGGADSHASRAFVPVFRSRTGAFGRSATGGGGRAGAGATSTVSGSGRAGAGGASRGGSYSRQGVVGSEMDGRTDGSVGGWVVRTPTATVPWPEGRPRQPFRKTVAVHGGSN